MVRPVKKPLEQWKTEILSAAQRLFLSKGYEQTSVSDIMEAVGGAKGMFYRCFESKEDVMQAVGDKLFFDNNPFEAVRERSDLNGLQKIRHLLMLNQSDQEREAINMEAVPILKEPRILAAAIEANCRLLTPLWFELLEEGRRDGSIETDYPKELSQLLPLINFWLLPSVYPDTAQGIRHKFSFIIEVLTKMGLPVFEQELLDAIDQQLSVMSPDEKE